MIESITPKDKKVEFEFIAAVPTSKDISQYENGIGPLEFDSIRVISYPGGQQFGAINPCEMNEFSDECDAWEAENGPYKKGEFMVWVDYVEKLGWLLCLPSSKTFSSL